MHTTKSEEAAGRPRRRKHTDEFKAAVVAECGHSGVSIARVALSHGLNANLLRKWVVNGERVEPRARTRGEAGSTIEMTRPSFVAVPLEAPKALPETRIDVEVRRGQMVVKVSWPMTASAECGGWLRELLR